MSRSFSISWLTIACFLALGSLSFSLPKGNVTKVNAFLNLFDSLPSASLVVKCSFDSTGNAIIKPLVEKLIDTSFYHFLDKPSQALEMHASSGGNYYACAKYPLSNNKMALLIRIPPRDGDLCIKLFLFDVTKGKCEKELELATVFADMGAFIQKQTYLQTKNGVLYLKIKSHEEGIAEMDTSYAKYRMTDSMHYYTVSYDKIMLTRRLQLRDSTWKK